jgi:radical SAM-linked protein
MPGGKESGSHFHCGSGMRLRITFAKTGSLRYTGHLDLHRIWERTCRRAGIPLSYSQGFHPQPRISLASALPLGILGQAELVDLWLDQEEDLQKIIKDLQNASPPGLILTSIQAMDQSLPALQTQVQSAKYEVVFLDPVDLEQLTTRLEDLLAAELLPRLRRGKEYDLRPLLESLELKDGGAMGSPILAMQLSASPSATGRPEEVLAALGFNLENTRITRTQLVLKNG